MFCKAGRLHRAQTESSHLITEDEAYITTEIRMNAEAASHYIQSEHTLCCQFSLLCLFLPSA